MTNKPKQIGTMAETAVVRYLQKNGFPHAERRALRGVHDAGDVTGCPGLCVEIKGGDAAKVASDRQIEAWLTETDLEVLHARADVGILVMQRAGYGAARCDSWWVAIRMRYFTPASANGPLADVWVRMTLDVAVRWLRVNGYGAPLDTTEDRGRLTMSA